MTLKFYDFKNQSRVRALRNLNARPLELKAAIRALFHSRRVRPHGQVYLSQFSSNEIKLRNYSKLKDPNLKLDT